jgi:hypothetical protein
MIVAFHLLSRSSGLERDRIYLNISQGSTRNYTWKLIDLLVSIANRHIQLTPLDQRCVGATAPFKDCTGFRDGTEISLREIPKYNWEQYFS